MSRDEIRTIKSCARLPCGRILPNRLVKAPMEELLGLGELTEELYEAWAAGGYGMIITGNVQVSPDHLGTPFDIAVPDPDDLARTAAVRKGFSRWAKSCRPAGRVLDPKSNSKSDPVHAPQPLAIVQLNHPGRQSMRRFCGRPASVPALAPSSVPLVVGTHPLARWLSGLLWGAPRTMTDRDLDRVVDQFVAGARLAHEMGWDGVELHASHGYLLAQFMSPKVNQRTDTYGGSARHRLTLLFRIVDAIRTELPQSDGFVLGIKLNSSDYVKGGLTEQDALDNVKWIAEHGGVDFIEISGGDYERPEFLNLLKPPNRPSAREAFFDAFSQRARWVISTLPASTLPSPPPLILLTGGLRTRSGIAGVLSSPTKTPPTADLVGLGRPAAADPFLPLRLTNPSVPSRVARAPEYDSLAGVRTVRWLFGWLSIAGPGLDVMYHTMLMRQIALRRIAAKRRAGILRSSVEKDEGLAAATGLPPRRGADDDDDHPLGNFWVLAWRVYVAPLLPVPGWLVGLAGGLVLALVGRRWK
ncbi:hypothetical protein JCM3774_002651 [Rhodotorula dairenensis]